MRFEVEGTAPIEGPTPEQVEGGLRALEGDGKDFAILQREPMTYLQAAPNGDGTYLLEYQDGSLDRHFAASRPLPLDDLVATFDAYLRQDDAWRSPHGWRPMNVTPGAAAPPAPGGGGRRAGLVLYTAAGLVCLAIALGLLVNGVGATLAGTGVAGVPGQVLVTSCTGRYGDNCAGVFISSSGQVPPAQVTIAGGPYRTPALVPGVHLLAGQAYPPVGAMAAGLAVDYAGAAIFLVAALSCGAMLLRRRARRAGRPARG